MQQSLFENNSESDAFTKDAKKYNSCLHELLPDEIWLGNHDVKIREDLMELKTIRLGQQAYCINGLPLHRGYIRPLIIHKSEEMIYNNIYMERIKKINENYH
jgi:hypothetical protein